MKQWIRYIGILVVVVFSIGGCNAQNNEDLQLYETKDEAIEGFKNEQSTAYGPVLKLEMNDNETVLLFRDKKDVYFLGELAPYQDKYTATKITSSVDIGNTTGAMWGFRTYKDNEYTIKISRDKEDNESTYISEFNLYISIVNGQRRYEDKGIINVIKSTEIY